MVRTFLLLLGCAASVSAADIVVAPSESIQSAIAGATDGDRVLVQPGTYGELIDFLGKAIEVIGTRGAAQTTIDAGGSGVVVRFASGEGPGSRLQGFTITGGYAAYGAGGIAAASGATPTIEDCIIRNNRGKFGGGISGSPTLRRCVIRDNTASVSHGGGIHGAPQMDHCVVASNTATHGFGGGAYFLGGDATVESCLFVENSSVLTGRKGGGAYVDSTANVAFDGCLFVDNFAVGGVFAGVGGGLCVESSGSSLVDSVVVGNLLSGSSVLGGGIYGPLAVTNTIVRGNTEPQLSAPGPVTYSDVEGGYAGLGNLDADPAFLDALSRDYHLAVGSPCVDAGDPALADPDGSRSDIGAYALQSLYTRDNARPTDWDDPSWPAISTQTGGQQALVVQAGAAHAGQVYWLLGSITGTSPGVHLLGQHVPLEFDEYFLLTINAPGAPPLVDSAGTLDSNGTARLAFALPPEVPVLAGLSLWHAALVFDISSWTGLSVTNTERLELLP